MPKKKKDAFGSLGQKIKKARISNKITFDLLANETGFTIDYLKDIAPQPPFQVLGPVSD